MSKKTRQISKQRTILLVVIIVLVGLVAAGSVYTYYFQKERQQESVATKNVVAEERKKLDNEVFRGDRDLAAQYRERILAGDPEGAYKVYESAIAKAEGVDAKTVLYKQGTEIAADAGQIEQAIKYMLALSELSATYRTFGSIADLYAEQKDSMHEREYLQKARAALDALPHDSPEYKSFVSYYDQRLSSMGDK